MFRRILSVLIVCHLAQWSDAEVQLHVSSQGDDLAEGTHAKPLATLQGARDRIRSLRAESVWSESYVVLVHPGRYELQSTFSLNAQDSGTIESPVTYRSLEGGVTVSGGRLLQDWRRVTDIQVLSQLAPEVRDRAVQADISSLNATLDLHPRRLNEEMLPEHSELFVGNRRLPVASWPNEGWARSKDVDTRSWKTEKADRQDDAWALGFWDNDWTMSMEPIERTGDRWTFAIDSVNGPKAVRENSRYRLCHVLSELDQPGEWYLYAAQGCLLYLPDSDSDAASATLSILETVISLYDVEHVRFEGIRFEAGRSMVAEVVRGQAIAFEDCQFANAGNVAVHLFGGIDHQLNRCEVCTTGSSAIRIEAGSRETLVPSNHSIENCDIHSFGQHFMARRAGIALYGVGAKLIRNRVHSGPDTAIGIYGNDNLIEHNEVYDVCKETDDSGAIYLGFDPTFQGNQIRFNYIRDLGGFSKTGIMGIYLDDYASGTTVESNYLINCIRGIAIGGGRDNVIRGNIIHGCLAAIQMDARGTTWYKSHVQGPDSRIQKLCRNTLEAFPVYAEKYPTLATMLDDQPELPKGNQVDSNEFDCPIGIDLQMPNVSIVKQTNNVRKPKSVSGTTDQVVAGLGIRLMRAQAKSDKVPIYVGTDRE